MLQNDIYIYIYHSATFKRVHIQTSNVAFFWDSSSYRYINIYIYVNSNIDIYIYLCELEAHETATLGVWGE